METPAPHSPRLKPQSSRPPGFERMPKWWERAIIYQIALGSFQDSNGDGLGDMTGLLRRIDYLGWLGVDAVWITPFYPTPFLDFGYDVSDFCEVDRRFGTLADFDHLVDELHSRDIKVILDFVPNHTSDQHPWFLSSRASAASAKHDWYIWADAGEDGGPPNNWVSRFGGSAWEWAEERRQYYYHSFLLEQPDLNWRNPAVRDALAEVLRFWMRRGADGFRVDASAVLSKDELMRDNPADHAADRETPPPQRQRAIFNDDRPEAMTYLEQMRSTIDEFDHRLLAGEVQGKTDRIGHFYGERRLHLPLNFALLNSHWDALSLQAEIDAYLKAIPQQAWPDWVIGGHDKPRIAGKIGQLQARLLAMLLMTLPGTPIFFAGDELGCEPVSIPAGRVRDPFEKLVPGYGLNRDCERAPMRWDATPHGGFTDGDPWLPMDSVRERNVESLKSDNRSILSLYRALIELRRKEPALTSGKYTPLRSRHDVLMFIRSDGTSELLIALNTMHQPRRCMIDPDSRVLLSTHLDRRDRLGAEQLLRADEGIIARTRL